MLVFLKLASFQTSDLSTYPNQNKLRDQTSTSITLFTVCALSLESSNTIVDRFLENSQRP
jgi:hypothetical protein